VPSIQPMASLLEQALFLFTDIVVMLFMERKGVSLQAMQENHTNKASPMPLPRAC
jgi:6-phospho-3-hexuloisomerase